jgi:hypothetical protein
MAPEFVVVPSSRNLQPDTLITFYLPMFYVEHKFTGRSFTVTPWGLVGFPF